MKKKQPRPWFRPQRGTFYVTLDGTQHNLHTADEAEAWERFNARRHRLSEEKVEQPQLPPESVIGLVQRFMVADLRTTAAGTRSSGTAIASSSLRTT